MPNLIKNILQFDDLKPDDIKFILNTICEQESIPSGEIKYRIDFNKIIPEPTRKEDCPEEYIWHIQNWGTRWNARDCYTEIIEIANPPSIRFVFTTAWSAPMKIITKLAMLDYNINFIYADEDFNSNNCGHWVYYVNRHSWSQLLPDDSTIRHNFCKGIWKKYSERR